MTNAKERDSSPLFLAWDVLEWLVRLRTAIIVSDYFFAVENKYMCKCINYRCRVWLRESAFLSTPSPCFSHQHRHLICHASHLSSFLIVSRLYVFRSNQDSKRAGRARTIRNISLCAGFGPAPPNRSNRAEDDGDVVGSRRTSFPLPSAAVFGSKSKETFPLASSRKLTLPLLSVLFPSTTSSTVRFDSLPLLCWLGQNTKETDRADAIILPSVIANILNLFVVRQHAPPLQPQLQHLR